METRKTELTIPRWQIAILLITSFSIFVFSISFETYLGELDLLFFVGSFLLFIPAYIILFTDIAARPITHLWSTAMLTVPVVTPFVYLAFRNKLKPAMPELV
ncbi:hypothetical protein BFP97_03550 [Roseivirga sp. 4D4]|uniref:hypothetical protein n=1 Tax=Roseivirga sp. 4D4 TaxID=1889784 RepID=UPI000852DAD1|nr:hypothetical protein [Roseivirga sp. 4D4]OEK00635.1 hypothetical protein BFP97_03550 [Roseivirga sp. 4D4]